MHVGRKLRSSMTAVERDALTSISIVLSHGGDESYPREDVYLFRSYDHEHRSEGLGQRFNLHKAQEVPIWEVARATSAAPSYFSDHLINGYRHTDGGIGANNPAHYAFNEMRQMNAGRDPYLVLSIGTGAPQDVFKTERAKKMACIVRREAENLLKAIRTMRKIVTDSEKAHEELMEIVSRAQGGDPQKPPYYYRFNVPDIAGIPLDEWRPKHGGLHTKSELRWKSEAYLRKPAIQRQMWQCAVRLIDLRRERADAEKWERVSMDTSCGSDVRSHSAEVGKLE